MGPLFLVPTEHGDWGPLTCRFVERLSNPVRDDLALVAVSPKIAKSHYRTEMDLDTLILAAKHEGQNIFEIKQFPIGVYVCVPKGSIVRGRVGELRVLAWGLLFPTLEDAEKAMSHWSED